MVKQDRLFFAQKLVILDIVLSTVPNPHTKQVQYIFPWKLKTLVTVAINIVSVSKSHMTTLCEIEFFNFLWLIWVHYLPLPSTKKDRPPRPP